jgi:hypothetical protein
MHRHFCWHIVHQYITERYTMPDIEKSVAAQQQRIVDLETELASLKPQ